MYTTNTLTQLMERNERLKELRFINGLSQDELAEKIGLPRTTWSGYENIDTRRIPYDILQRVADVLNSTPEWIMHEKGDMTRKESNKNINKSPQSYTNTQSISKTQEPESVDYKERYYRAMGQVDLLKEEIDRLRHELQDCLHSKK